MRILGTFLLGAGLLVPGLGCSRTLQMTTGVCDCDPPPVRSLLACTTNGHSSLGVYGTVAHAPGVVGNGSLPRSIDPLPGPAPIATSLGIIGQTSPPGGVERVPVVPQVVVPVK